MRCIVTNLKQRAITKVYLSKRKVYSILGVLHRQLACHFLVLTRELVDTNFLRCSIKEASSNSYCPTVK
jgi:hypothetical protein